MGNMINKTGKYYLISPKNLVNFQGGSLIV